jgi:alpha-galactosidase/6-phospho-beta-glucosidase family protein
MASIEQAKKQAQEQATMEALKATDQQWQVILPRWRKVQELRQQARISAGINDAVWITEIRTRGSNTQETHRFEDWSWKKPWEGKSELTKQEKTCQELLDVLENKNITEDELRLKIDALRQAKQEAAKQLAQARQELCEVLTFRQQAILVMMGILD